MSWHVTDFAQGTNVVDEVSGAQHDYVTRTYVPDEDDWPRWTIRVSHFRAVDSSLSVEVFFRVDETSHGAHATDWPLSLLGPIMATCKWAQDEFKVNLMEPWLGTDSTNYPDALGPFALRTEAVKEVDEGINATVLSRVNAEYEDWSLGSYYAEVDGERRLLVPEGDLWSPVEYGQAVQDDPDGLLPTTELNFRHDLADEYPDGERALIWNHITRAVIFTWQERML